MPPPYLVQTMAPPLFQVMPPVAPPNPVAPLFPPMPPPDLLAEFREQCENNGRLLQQLEYTERERDAFREHLKQLESQWRRPSRS